MPSFSSFLANIVRSPASAAENTVQPTGAAIVPLTVKGASAQSANLTEWKDSSGTAIAYVESTGKLTSTSAIDAGTGKVRLTSGGSILLRDTGAPYIEFLEAASAPAAGASDTARLYVEDNGSGKTRLVVKFATGAAIVLATQA